MEIDIESAIDRLNCMSKEILIDDSLKKINPVLADSRQRDKELLRNLIPLVRAIGNLEIEAER
jgi:hypothetical protein